MMPSGAKIERSGPLDDRVPVDPWKTDGWADVVRELAGIVAGENAHNG